MYTGHTLAVPCGIASTTQDTVLDDTHQNLHEGLVMLLLVNSNILHHWGISETLRKGKENLAPKRKFILKCLDYQSSL